MPKCTILKAIAEALDPNQYPCRGQLTTTPRPRLTITRFQETLVQELEKKLKLKTGGPQTTEVPLFSNAGDRADILIPNVRGYTVIIEIDATRADQVAKKMMSRFYWAMPPQVGSPICCKNPGTPVVYVSLLYPGTNAMNPEECKKYFMMGAEVLTKLNSNNIFIGYIISDALKNDYCYCSGSSVCGCSGAVSCNCCTSKNGVDQMSAPVVPPQQACNGTSMKGPTINDAKAADADLYRKYLEDHGVQSLGSIECYMHPLNIVHSIGLDSDGIKTLQTQLANLPFQNWLNSLMGTLNKYRPVPPFTPLSLSRNQISYWKKYCAYCRAISNGLWP